MNPFQNLFNNMSSGPQLRTHGSVEDLIRGVLGNSFMEKLPQEQEEKIEKIPDYVDQEVKTIAPPEPKEKKEKPKKIEKYCDSCDRPESKCICEEEFDEVDYGGDLEIEIEEPEDFEGEEELSPFEEVVRKLKSEKKEAPRYQNTQGIGLKPKEKIPAKPISKHYPFYRDLDEVFECNATIEGTMRTATVRLILNTDTWNLVFYGKIKRDGTCLIPIKKLAILPSGTTGRATLEVVVDDVVFYPWENAFRVEESRKVQVQIKGKSNK